VFAGHAHGAGGDGRKVGVGVVMDKEADSSSAGPGQRLRGSVSDIAQLGGGVGYLLDKGGRRCPPTAAVQHPRGRRQRHPGEGGDLLKCWTC
jgi:hypothetical protein